MQPTFDPVNNVDSNTKKESKNTYSRQWHANLTPKKRMARQERERGNSKTRTWKESCRDAQRQHRELQKHIERS
jgi:hypothetical protein